MKNRCAGLTVLLLLIGAIDIGNAKTDFHGVLHSLSATGAVDSVYLIVPPDSLTYSTAGWGGIGVLYDTFDFPDSLNAWPQRVWVMGTGSGGFPTKVWIEDPLGHRWYALDMSMDMYGMFYGEGGPGVEEPRRAVEPLQRLTVSPSVVTGQMAVRLQPVGTGSPVVEIHDAVGKVIRSLDCPAGADGIATVTWNREDGFGRLVPEGVYLCRYAAADVIVVRKVLVAH